MGRGTFREQELAMDEGSGFVPAPSSLPFNPEVEMDGYKGA